MVSATVATDISEFAHRQHTTLIFLYICMVCLQDCWLSNVFTYDHRNAVRLRRPQHDTRVRCGGQVCRCNGPIQHSPWVMLQGPSLFSHPSIAHPTMRDEDDNENRTQAVSRSPGVGSRGVPPFPTTSAWTWWNDA